MKIKLTCRVDERHALDAKVSVVVKTVMSYDEKTKKLMLDADLENPERELVLLKPLPYCYVLFRGVWFSYDNLIMSYWSRDELHT